MMSSSNKPDRNNASCVAMPMNTTTFTDFQHFVPANNSKPNMEPSKLVTKAANERIFAQPGTVKAAIQKFGGERPLVQRRLDQLEKKWEQDAHKTKPYSYQSKWVADPVTKTYKKV